MELAEMPTKWVVTTKGLCLDYFSMQGTNKMDKANIKYHTENRVFVIFSIIEDPRKEELVPTFYNLYAEEIVRGKVAIVCGARRIITEKDALYVVDS